MKTAISIPHAPAGVALRAMSSFTLPLAKLMPRRSPVGSGAIAPTAASPKKTPGLDLVRAVLDGFRFRLNKLVYGRIFPLFHRTLVTACSTGESRIVREAGVVTRAGIGYLPYYVTLDERGNRRGGQPPWKYLQNLASSTDDRTKKTICRQLLAQLPTGVSFHFVFSPALADVELVRAVFKSAGFRPMDVETYVCARAPENGDLINSLTGKSIKGTLKRARRDLEIVEISADDFFNFHRENLKAAGRHNYRDTVSDRLMLEDGLLHNHARIIAARRKPTSANPGPFPVDAAIACLWDKEDGIYKLWRTSRRLRDRSDTAPKPHTDATKFLILAVMEDAAAKKLTLETDGSTLGLARLYALFGPGIFQRKTRLQCEHETVWSTANRYYPSLFRKTRFAGSTDGNHGHA
jgi:hypothetical protein